MQKIVQIDSFTDTRYAGNPAGVCPLEKAADEEWMQKVAMEMNLSETAFFYKTGEGYNLRWFTPKCEVEMCGHATLATAFYLFAEGEAAEGERIAFHTKSGPLYATREGDWICLDFPLRRPETTELPEGFERVLGVHPLAIGRYANDYVVEVESETVVRGLSPDFGAMEKSPVRGVIVTARSEGEYDFVSRFFAPAMGINEDPVTGAAHTILAPFWADKLGKNEMTGFQASSRGGVVRVRIDGDRVVLFGRAVFTIRGELV